jgi:beta-lactamase class D
LKELEKRVESLERKQPAVSPQSTQDILLLLRALDDQPLSDEEEQRIAEMWVEDEKVLKAFQEGRLEKVLVPGHGYRVIIHDTEKPNRMGVKNVE